MKNRKMLYGYYIEQGVFHLQDEEAVVVQRIMDLYIEGLSYLTPDTEKSLGRSPKVVLLWLESRT